MGLPRKDASDRCYATEFLLRSGRGAAVAADDAMEPLGPVLRRPPEDHEFYLGRIEVGLRQVGRRLDNLMATLAPYRSANDDLDRAFVEAHDALGDLAATYTWVTLGVRPARRALPAPRRRPWGG